MINGFLKFILLTDILQSIWAGIKVAITKKPVTVKLPKQTVKRQAHFRSQFTMIDGKCVACGACAKICPCSAIIIIDKKNYTYSKEKCAHCGLCQKICPKLAIKFESIAK